MMKKKKAVYDECEWCKTSNLRGGRKKRYCNKECRVRHQIHLESLKLKPYSKQLKIVRWNETFKKLFSSNSSRR